ESAHAVSELRPPWACLNAGSPMEEGPLPATPEGAKALRELRQGLAEARGLLFSGKYLEAEGVAAAQGEAASAAGLLGAQVEAAGLRGEAQLRNGRLTEAEATLSRGVMLAETAQREDLTVELSTLLSVTYLRESRLPESQLWADHGKAALRRMGGADDVVEAELLEQQARLSSASGHWPDAAEPLKRAVQLKLHALGPTHPEVAETMLALAKEMKGGDQLGEALATARSALQILEKTYPVEHPEVARAWSALAQIHRDRGEHREELDYARRVLEFRQRAAAPGSMDLAGAHVNVATALDNLGEHERALVEYRVSLAALEAAFAEMKDRNAAIGSLVMSVGAQYWELGEDAASLPYFQRSLQINERALAGHAQDPKMVHPLYAIGVALSGMGRAAEADRYFQQAVAAARRLSDRNYDLYYAYEAEGRAVYERGQFARSRERMERALEVRKLTAPPDSAVLALVEAELARAELGDEQADAAWKRARAAVEVVEKVLGPEARRLAVALAVAGEARRRLGDPAGGLPYLERAVALCERYRYRPLLEAEARTWLAAALRDLHRDLPRAQALAAAAREQLAHGGGRAVIAPRVDR
ncbi:MAG TPA: tetratricopeptide repeat protein, partial [Myxococcales bacterium]|nr:tetratricopeptide repeat protein [Myxococcales bacterium]